MQPNPNWTSGAKSAAQNEGLHETFAKVALDTPESAAIISGTTRVSYGTLNRTADAWASELVEAGVTKCDLVPILLPRGIDLVTALLAVLKAGAAYALLDPSWPERRLLELLDVLESPLIITDGEEVCRQERPVWSPPGCQVMLRADFSPARVDGSSPCCVFFTSGTTGRPNGVVIPHRATARIFQRDFFAWFASDTVMPLAAPTSWDAFSLELWSVLLNGGTSLIVSDPYLSSYALRCGVSQHGVDTVWLTSSLFNMIMDEDPHAFLGLRQVLIGGERLSISHVRRFLRQFPKTHLLNGYGPVESTIFATTHTITTSDCDKPTGIPLGRPVPSTQVFVLDRSRTCEVGEIGEICIAGDGLALGYLGDTQLTSTKFQNTEIDGTVHRIYRTGDLGFWSNEGLLNFSGRADRQLKIQGNRVEPTEVESQIELLLPEVQDCRVLARVDDDGHATDLIAFCKPRNRGNPLQDAMELLRSGLISYQRPKIVVSVDDFPLTATGKLDERALFFLLPNDKAGRRGECSLYGPNDDSTTSVVAKTFEEVLEVADFHLDKTFFENGGTSLGAGRACARLTLKLGRHVPISWLYQFPTVHALAKRLEVPNVHVEQRAASGESVEVPLTPMQRLFLTRHLINPNDLTSLCLLVWIIEGSLNVMALRSAVAVVHQRHEALRSAYVPRPRPLARPLDVPPSFHVLEASSSIDHGMQTLREMLADGLHPTRGEVWRAAVAPVETASLALFGCAVHHIAFDGGSRSVLAKDLSDSYNAIITGESPPASPPTSLLQTSNARTAYLAGLDLSPQRQYHVTELSGVPDLRWPTTVSVSPSASGRANRIVSSLPPDLVAAVDRRARDAGVTRFVVLISYYAKALSDVTGQRDFSIAVPIRQRHFGSSEQSIGCHVDTTFLRFRGAALEDGADTLSRTSLLVQSALAAQDVSICDILSLLRPNKTFRPPLSQTLFALQDDVVPTLTLAALRTTFIRQPYLDLPLELHTELWPLGDGGLRMEISYRTNAIAESDAQSVASRYLSRLRAIPSLAVC